VSATPVCRVSGSPISRVKALLQLPGASPQSPRREPTQATRSLLPPPGRDHRALLLPVFSALVPSCAPRTTSTTRLVPDAQHPMPSSLPPIGGTSPRWTTPHSASRNGRLSSTSRQRRDTASPPTRKLPGRAAPRGSSPVRLQSGGAVLRRGLPILLGPARRPTLPPRRAPHLPGTPSGLTH
jgi:hypothetical protein